LRNFLIFLASLRSSNTIILSALFAISHCLSCTSNKDA
jgi:hypothetical protein